jgi:hypothetical protein
MPDETDTQILQILSRQVQQIAPALVLRYRAARDKNVVLAMGWSNVSFSFWWGGLTAGAGRRRIPVATPTRGPAQGSRGWHAHAWLE